MEYNVVMYLLYEYIEDVLNYVLLIIAEHSVNGCTSHGYDYFQAYFSR